MKAISLASVFLGLCAAAATAAPEFPAGTIFYAHRGSALAHFSTSEAFELRAGGEWRGVLSLGQATNGGTPQLGPVGNGTWRYDITGPTTARLVLGCPDRAFADAEFVLQFTSESEGTLAPNWPDDGGTFRFAPMTPPSALVNSSNRSWVRPEGTALAGFVIAGNASRGVLIRAVGPGLQRFGLTDGLAHPALRVTRLGSDLPLGSNAGWTSPESGREASILRTGALVGAFPLEIRAADAALILYLRPGAYVAEVASAVAGESGQVLLETYLLP
jgi:hypothetical protein